MSRRKWMWAILLLFAGSLSSPDAKSAPLSRGIAGLSLPQGLRLSPLGEPMMVNGLQMEVAYFETDRAPDVVAEKLIHRLGQIRSQRAGEWQVLSLRDDDRLLSIQLRARRASGTQGIIAISDLFDAIERRRKLPRQAFPLPPDTRVIQDMKTDDAGARGHTVILHSEQTPQDALDFYRAHFSRSGFEPVTQGSLSRAGHGGAMVLNRGGEQINVAATTRDGSTLIAIVRVRP